MPVPVAPVVEVKGLGFLTGLAALGLAVLGLTVESSSEVGLRWRTVGVGKLSRLSIASTVRWKRRKRDWARRRVEGRSIFPDNSFTVSIDINLTAPT